jgi:hypothetical protein
MTQRYLIKRYVNPNPLCGRHVRHDPASRAYTYPTDGLPLVDTIHTRHAPIFDQANLGSCTCNAGLGNLLCDPFYAVTWDGVLYPATPNTVPRVWPYTPDEPGAVKLYSDVTAGDDYPGGYYAPDWTDTGSDGLTVGKVLKAAGMIAGYEHTFSLDAALRALGQTPFITGTDWLNSMFTPDADGRVRVDYTAGLAGGHEYLAVGLDVARRRVWFDNSWGPDWGLDGTFYLTWDDYDTLLSHDGDVTIFTPLSQPAPTPTPPVPGVDLTADVLHEVLTRTGWGRTRHCCNTRRVATALNAWDGAHYPA